jgi:protein TonB
MGKTMYLESNPRDRIRAAAPALVVHALLALLILRGLGVATGLAPPEALKLVNVTPPAPPAPIVRPVRAPDRSSRREGAAAPPALEARPTEIVAPPPVLPPLPALPAAPVAGPGSAPASGATPFPGPGTGAAGIGNGTGSGRFGNGPGNGLDGDGDGDGGATPPRRIRGRISDRDYPAEAGDAGVGGMVSVIYTVQTDGSATDCRITRSSGNRALDLTTCRLIEQRFHFEPSRDRNGRPVRSRLVQDHYWEVEDLPPDPNEPPRRRRFRIF